MKATELMIGDWVECSYWTPSKQLKVAEIRRIMDDEIKIGVYSDDLVLIFRQSEVKPIPLTPEILVKNGFEMVLDKYKLPTYRVKCTCNPYLHFTVFTGVDGYWNPVGLNVIIGGIPATVDYVHELQHALRLCGINKEITL